MRTRDSLHKVRVAFFTLNISNVFDGICSVLQRKSSLTNTRALLVDYTPYRVNVHDLSRGNLSRGFDFHVRCPGENSTFSTGQEKKKKI